jgi:WD40 repeat protein
VINPENANSEFEDQYLAYQCEEKIVGIIKLPVDGNPDKTMGLIAHPGTIASIACSGDGKRFFTCGGDDQTINIWEIFKGAISDNFVKCITFLKTIYWIR